MEELEKLFNVLSRDGYFGGSLDSFMSKFKSEEYQNKVFDVVSRDQLFGGDINSFKSKYAKVPSVKELPEYNPEYIKSASEEVSAIDVAAYNINDHTSLFNQSEGKAMRQLQELYPDFNFEQVALGSKEGGGLDAVRISTKDGKNSTTFDMNIGGLNLYGAQYSMTEEEGIQRSFNTLKDFVDNYSTEEGKVARLKNKQQRQQILNDINTQRDEVAAEEIAKIQEDFDSGELFKLKTDKKVGLMGGLEILIGGQEAIPNVVVNTVMPYKEELKRALDDLKAEYKLEGKKETPSRQEVEARALEYIIDGVQEKALAEIMETSKVQGEIDLSSLEYGGVIESKVANVVRNLFTNEINIAEKYTLAAKEFDIDFNKDYDTLLVKALDLDEGDVITRFNELNSQLKNPNFNFQIMPGESVATMADGRQIPERVFNEMKGLNIKLNNKIKAFRSFQEKVMEKAVKYQDNVAAVDIARRNYDGLEKFLVTIGLGTTEMFFNATIGKNLSGGGYKQDSIDFLSELKTKTTEVRESYAKDVKFEDAFNSLENFATFAAQETANQIPVFATLAIPVVGAGVLGFSAFGEHYTNLAVERNSPKGRQLSNAEMWWMSAGFGASELVFESLTTVPLLRAAKRGFSATPGTKTLTDLTFGKYFKKNIGKTVYGIASEPIGEGMTQLTQNIIDGKPLTQNLAHAMFSGLMFGTTLSVAPFARGLYLSQFNDHNANIEYRERVDKIKSLNKTNSNIKINLKAGITNAGTQADIDANEKAIKELQAKNETHVREQEALVNTLSDDATKYYFALNAELEGIKNEAIEVEGSDVLSDKQKNDRLKALQVKFDDKQRQKDFFRDKDAFGNEWDAYSALDENAEDVADLKKQAGDELMNVNLEATKARRKEPTEIEINQRAKFLYNIRKIKKDHAANSKAGLTDTKLFETNEDAITWVEKQTNISEATKAEFFNEIKGSNAHGANIKTQDGFQIPFIIANNMAMDDRLETRTHELGHSVFIKAIGSNPAAFKELSDQITEYLKQANPAAHKRLMFRLNQAGAIKDKLYDETIMVFLEEVASGKVDVAKSKQAGFLANLMNKGIEKVGGRKIDLKGETDAINFLIGIAKKIKAGTIDTKDIQAIRENRIAKQAEESAPKTETESDVKFSKMTTAQKAKVKEKVDKLGQVDTDGNNLREKDTGRFYYQADVDNVIKELRKKRTDKDLGLNNESYLDNLIAAKYKVRPVPEAFVNDVFNELLTDIKGFNPEENNSLFGYLGPRITFRAGDVYKKIYEKKGPKKTIAVEERTREGEVRIQLEADIDSAMEALETEDLSPVAQAKKNKAKKQRYSKFRRDLGFDTESKIYNDVLSNVKKSLMMAYGATQNITDAQLRAKAIAAKLKKEYANLNSPLFKQIKNFLTYGVADTYVKRGTKDIYISQLKKFRENIVENISTADLVQIEKKVAEGDRIFTKFVATLTSKQQVQDAVNKEQLEPSALNKITRDKKTGKGAYSVNLYQKTMPTEAELISWADQPGINPITGARQGLKGTRKDGIVMRMVNGLVTDAIMEARQSEEVQNKIAEMDVDPGSVAELGAAIGREVNVKFSKSNAIGDISAAIDGAGDVNVYSQIKFSKAHRDAYEKQLTKKRPDLTEDQRKNAVQSVFDFVDGKDIPNNKKSKYEKMAMHYTANGHLILPEDGYKVIEAERLATQKKIDPFSFKNPNELIETFVGEVKGARTNPDKVKTFTNKTELTDGVTVYNVEDSKQGQKDVRKVIDTHFGEKSNPWCLAARGGEARRVGDYYNSRQEAQDQVDMMKSDPNSPYTDIQVIHHKFPKGESDRYHIFVSEGNELTDAWRNWKSYNQKGNGFKIAFHNGRLVAFRDGNNMSWWDRNDKATDAPVVRGKKDKDGFKPVSLVYKNKSEVIHKEKVTGNKKNGTTTRKDLDGNLIFQETKKNGKTDGLNIEVDNKNKRSNDYNLKRTQNFKNGERLDFKEERTYSNPKALEAVSFGKHNIRVDNITKYDRSFTEDQWVMETETITIEGTVNQKYFKEFQDPSELDGFEKTNLKYLTPTHQRYYDIQGKKVKVVKTTKYGDSTDGTGKTTEDVTVTINGVKQEIIALFSDSDVKFSLTKLEVNNKLDPYIIKMIEGSKNGVNPIAEYFYSSMQVQLSNGVKVDVAYDIAYNNTEKTHGIGFIALKDFENNVKSYYAADIREDGKKYATDYYKDQLKTVETNKNTVNIDELNTINDYLINIGRPIRSAMVDYITTNENLLEEVYKKFGEKYRGHYHLVPVGKKGFKVEFSEKKNGKQQSINLYQEVTAIKKNPANYEQTIDKQAELARTWLNKLLDSGMDKGKIKAILRLTSYGQRSPIRKLSKLGVYVETGIAKDLVLEHEITANDILAEITKHIDGKIDKAQLESFLNKTYVHVLPKGIDTLIKKYPGHTSNRNGQGYESMPLVENKVKELNTNNKLKGKTWLFKLSKTNKLQNTQKAINVARLAKKPTQGITVLDFDDTLATSKSLIKFTKPDGTTGTLNAEQYASTYESLSELGYKFDFSEFTKVVEGQTAPLFNKALKLQSKFGPENMFILTARPAESAPAIFEFLKANGLNIPLKNITGLANSTAEAKANWIAGKVGEGYNDFYFADDALQNVKAVQNMLDQFDVKSKVQQAKVKFSKTMNDQFNSMIERVTGVDSKKEFSATQAKIKGQKTKYKSIIPPSAQDFMGLLYNFIGKGKQGDIDMAFFKKALIDPFARGVDELNGSRQAASDDFKNLNKEFKNVKDKLTKKIEGLDFNHDQAIRVYLWNKAGFEIPGLSEKDLNALDSFVRNDSELQAYADAIGLISKKDDGYSVPSDYWLAENLASDLLSDGAIGDARAEYLGEWQQNVDEIFNKENLNKIEAIYGSKFREALEDVLYRMKTGKNRPSGGGRIMNMYMNWVNNSVGAIMFFNMRSALLQTISATNYINWSFNNPAKAAGAFANQPQYWKDFTMLFNSDYLKQRRSGNRRGINEAELSAAVAGSDNKAKAAIAWLLKKGFLPTQLADSFAIAAGGATFYRNKVKALMKQGMSQADAEAQAFLDFQETTEVSQQSARPDMISQQQASPLGRLILSFQNTPMQYARIINKSARDLANGRGDAKTHISKIAYYSTVQGIIFTALQSALFAALGDDEEELYDKKKERMLNQMIDSLLSGIGYGGKAISTAKNTIMEYSKQKSKKWNADHAYTLLTLLGFSPPIGSKLRKVYSSIKTEEFNKGVFGKRGFTLDNPIWSGIGNVIEGVTNVPLGRMAQKMLNVDNALDANHEWWERVALLLGWNTWDLGVKDPDIEAIKQELKKKKEQDKKRKKKKKQKTGGHPKKTIGGHPSSSKKRQREKVNN